MALRKILRLKFRPSSWIKSRLFCGIIVVELLIIGFLIAYIASNRYQVLGVNPIKANALRQYQSGSLRFFFEPKPNSIQSQQTSYSATAPQQHINADSLNAIRDFSVAKPASTYRIITLGDSYTYGLFLNTADNYPSQLETLLNQSPLCSAKPSYEVINLAMQAYDIEYSVERFRLRGVKYASDQVLWLVKDDDFFAPSDLMQEKSNQLEKPMRESGEFDRLKKMGYYYPVYFKAEEEVRKELTDEQLVERAAAAFDRYRRLTHVKTTLLVFPNLQPKIKTYLTNYVAAHPNLTIYELPTIYTQKENYFKDHHPTKSGDTVIAKSVADYLHQQHTDCP